MTKHTYAVNSTSDSPNSTIINFATTNVNNNKIKFDEVNKRHNKKIYNATKNNQIVEKKYGPKIRRYLNKIESHIKKNKKKQNPTYRRTEKDPDTKISETTNNNTDTTTKFSENVKISPTKDPKNCNTYVDILFSRTHFSVFKENATLDDHT